MDTMTTTRVRVGCLDQHGAGAHVARILGVSRCTVWGWRRDGVPAARVDAVRAALATPRRVHVEGLQSRAACVHVAQALGVHEHTVAAWRRPGVQARRVDDVRAALTTYTPPPARRVRVDELTRHGARAFVAVAVGASKTTVSNWRRDGVPAARVGAVRAALAKFTARRVRINALGQRGACAHVARAVGRAVSVVATWRENGVPADCADAVRAALEGFKPPAPRVDVEELHQKGGCGHVARALGVTTGAVSQWRKGGVPAARVDAVRAALATLPGSGPMHLDRADPSGDFAAWVVIGPRP